MNALTDIDLSVLNWIQENLRCAFLDVLAPIVTMFGDKGIFWIAVALLLLCFKKTRKTGAMMGAALLIGVIFGNGILKNVIARTRPYDLPGVEIELLVERLSDFSFPSGHTLASFECATVLMCRDRRFGIPALVLAVLIALSRLYLFVHFPSDVIGGALLGAAIGLLAVFAVGRLWNRIAAHYSNKGLRTKQE